MLKATVIEVENAYRPGQKGISNFFFRSFTDEGIEGGS